MSAPTYRLAAQLPHLKGLQVSWGKAQGEILRRVRTAMQQATFSDVARVAFAKALTVKAHRGRLDLTVNHPAWKYQVQGQKRGPMTWLVKAKAPIPIVAAGGKVIFRQATARSLADGSWVHPGRKPVDFEGLARKEIERYARDQFAVYVAQQILKALT